MIGTIAIAALAVIAVWGVLIFNALIKARNQTSAAWSDIDVQLQRRHDLIPKLVDAVRAYAGYERATLEAVTELRTQSEQTQRVAEIAVLEQQIEQGLHELIALAEDYPELKANQNFLQLQHDLVETEDHLQYARRFYNGSVRNFNTRIQSFPDLLVARPFGFGEAEFFDAEARAEAPISVDMSR